MDIGLELDSSKNFWVLMHNRPTADDMNILYVFLFKNPGRYDFGCFYCNQMLNYGEDKCNYLDEVLYKVYM